MASCVYLLLLGFAHAFSGQQEKAFDEEAAKKEAAAEIKKLAEFKDTDARQIAMINMLIGYKKRIFDEEQAKKHLNREVGMLHSEKEKSMCAQCILSGRNYLNTFETQHGSEADTTLTSAEKKGTNEIMTVDKAELDIRRRTKKWIYIFEKKGDDLHIKLLLDLIKRHYPNVPDAYKTFARSISEVQHRFNIKAHEWLEQLFVDENLNLKPLLPKRRQREAFILFMKSEYDDERGPEATVLEKCVKV